MAYPGRLEETLEEHRRIVDTIAQGDAVAAQKASEYHMDVLNILYCLVWKIKMAICKIKNNAKDFFLDMIYI